MVIYTPTTSPLHSILFLFFCYRNFNNYILNSRKYCDQIHSIFNLQFKGPETNNTGLEPGHREISSVAPLLTCLPV